VITGGLVPVIGGSAAGAGSGVVERAEGVITGEGRAGSEAVIGGSVAGGGSGVAPRAEASITGPGHPPSTNRRRVPTRRSAGGNRVRETSPSWPGRLPAPSPATVPPQRLPAELFAADGRPVLLAAPDLLSAPPSRLVVDAEARTVQGWAGPWPLQQRWWSPDAVASSRV
jgi:protein ImuB